VPRDDVIELCPELLQRHAVLYYLVHGAAKVMQQFLFHCASDDEGMIMLLLRNICPSPRPDVLFTAEVGDLLAERQ
jgi:hypothetical protein